MTSAYPEQPVSHPTSGTEDDDDDRDDEHEGENEALVRETDEATEAPEEFVEDEWDASPGYEGTTAVGPAKKLLPARRKGRPRADRRQLALPRVGS